MTGTLVVLFGALAILWLVSLLAVLTNPDRYEHGTQMIWVLVILLAGPIGTVIYQVLGPVRSRPALDPRALQDADRRAMVQQEADRRKFLR